MTPCRRWSLQGVLVQNNDSSGSELFQMGSQGGESVRGFPLRLGESDICVDEESGLVAYFGEMKPEVGLQWKRDGHGGCP